MFLFKVFSVVFALIFVLILVSNSYSLLSALFGVKDENVLSVETIIGEIEDGLTMMKEFDKEQYSLIIPLSIGEDYYLYAEDNKNELCLFKDDGDSSEKVYCDKIDNSKVRILLTGNCAEDICSKMSAETPLLLPYRLSIEKKIDESILVKVIAPDSSRFE